MEWIPELKLYKSTKFLWEYKELDVVDEVEYNYRRQFKKLSTPELLDIFPEGQNLITQKLRKEKKLLGQKLDNLTQQRQKSFDNEDSPLVIELWDDLITEVQLQYERVSTKLKFSKKPSDNIRIEKARSVKIEEVLGIHLKRSKQMINCVFHHDKTPSMMIYRDENRFYSFCCGEFGDAIDLYAKLNNVSIGEAIKALSSF